jgi:hypothetical protein
MLLEGVFEVKGEGRHHSFYFSGSCNWFSEGTGDVIEDINLRDAAS